MVEENLEKIQDLRGKIANLVLTMTMLDPVLGEEAKKFLDAQRVKYVNQIIESEKSNGTKE